MHLDDDYEFGYITARVDAATTLYKLDLVDSIRLTVIQDAKLPQAAKSMTVESDRAIIV